LRFAELTALNSPSVPRRPLRNAADLLPLGDPRLPAALRRHQTGGVATEYEHVQRMARLDPMKFRDLASHPDLTLDDWWLTAPQFLAEEIVGTAYSSMSLSSVLAVSTCRYAPSIVPDLLNDDHDVPRALNPVLVSIPGLLDAIPPRTREDWLGMAHRTWPDHAWFPAPHTLVDACMTDRRSGLRRLAADLADDPADLQRLMEDSSPRVQQDATKRFLDKFALPTE
jgi:hypothetical protein